MTYPLIIENHNEDILNIETNIQQLQTFQANLINLVYPVGSIYMSVNNVSPQTFLGGTWEQIKDRFLLSAGDTYSSGSIGGEANHTLTTEELASHNHGWSKRYMMVSNPGAVFAINDSNFDAIAATDNAITDGGVFATPNFIEYTGSNRPHNNMPPYLTVYMWKRIS